MAATPMDEMVERVRMFLRDHPILNKLIHGNETNDTQLRIHILDAVDDFNFSPPLLAKVTVETYPSKRLLTRGAVIEALTSAGILQSRNRLSYSDGGISVQVSDKAQEYMAWINFLVVDYEKKKLELKKTINTEQAYGGIHSEYFESREDDNPI